jgi:hypothetical protein
LRTSEIALPSQPDEQGDQREEGAEKDDLADRIVLAHTLHDCGHQREDERGQDFQRDGDERFHVRIFLGEGR